MYNIEQETIIINTVIICNAYNVSGKVKPLVAGDDVRDLWVWAWACLAQLDTFCDLQELLLLIIIRVFSKLCSCPRKFMFGPMIGRLALTKLYACIIDMLRVFMMYAMARVDDLEMPAWQWSSTFLFFSLASSVEIRTNTA